MKLLVEIGNTRVKWALSNDGLLSQTGACTHGGDTDWPRHLPAAAPASIRYASVAAAEVADPLFDWAATNDLPAPRRIVSTAQAAGVTNAYAEPVRLGVDRWLACLGAHRRARGASALVVDAGTALTVDFVAADGRHGGGLICPGVTVMRDAIRSGTQVRAEECARAGDWLGTDTDAAVGLGTLQAALGVIERARAALRPERLFLAGGEAELLVPHLDGSWERVPTLVLEGLALAADEAERAEAMSGSEPANEDSR